MSEPDSAAPPDAGARPPTRIGRVALWLALTGAVALPGVGLVLGVALDSTTLDTLTLALMACALLCGLSALVVGIIALVRREERRDPIIALVLGALALPASAAVSLFTLLTGPGGAHGRPLRVNDAPRRTGTTDGADWSEDGPRPDTNGLDGEVRARLAAGWLGDASLEHASVAAFSALSLDLLALGAPPSLLRRVHEAALDEVAHARDCFALASAYAGAPRTAAPFPEARAPLARESHAQRLLRVAIETAVDGCVGESCAARVACESSSSARDPAVSAVLARIARDEASHADLAWDVLHWCLRAGDAALECAVLEAVSRAPAPSSRTAEVDLSSHGRVAAGRWATVYEAQRREVRERLTRRGASYARGRADVSERGLQID